MIDPDTIGTFVKAHARYETHEERLERDNKELRSRISTLEDENRTLQAWKHVKCVAEEVHLELIKHLSKQIHKLEQVIENNSEQAQKIMAKMWNIVKEEENAVDDVFF